MATKKITTPPDQKTHIGYNEKNPTQPQGAFKADSQEAPPAQGEKTEKGPGIKKQYSKK
jgi:hypothetical protein